MPQLCLYNNNNLAPESGQKKCHPNCSDLLLYQPGTFASSALWGQIFLYLTNLMVGGQCSLFCSLIPDHRSLLIPPSCKNSCPLQTHATWLLWFPCCLAFVPPPSYLFSNIHWSLWHPGVLSATTPDIIPGGFKIHKDNLFLYFSLQMF